MSAQWVSKIFHRNLHRAFNRTIEAVRNTTDITTQIKYSISLQFFRLKNIQDKELNYTLYCILKTVVYTLMSVLFIGDIATTKKKIISTKFVHRCVTL